MSKPSAWVLALAALAAAPGCTPGESGWLCRDGLDNDGDGLVDCSESACADHVDCAARLLLPEDADHFWAHSADFPLESNFYGSIQSGGDLNGDGASELVAGGVYGLADGSFETRIGLLTVGEGEGDTFDMTPRAFSLPSSLTEPPAITADCDFDGDGRADLLLTQGLLIRSSLMGADGSEMLSDAEQIEPSNGARAICAGDVTGDGVQDLLLFARPLGESVELVSGAQMLELGSLPAAVVRGWSFPRQTGAYPVGDLDGDGAADVLIGLGRGLWDHEAGETTLDALVIPGGVHLGAPGPAEPAAEVRPPVELWVTAIPQTVEPIGEAIGHGVADIDGDGRAEWYRIGFSEEESLFFELPTALDGVRVIEGQSGHAPLTETVFRGGDDLRVLPAAYMGTRDIDGDGTPDLLVRTTVQLAPETSPYRTDQVSGILVYLDIDADSPRPWWTADVLAVGRSHSYRGWVGFGAGQGSPDEVMVGFSTQGFPDAAYPDEPIAGWFTAETLLDW